LEDEGWEPGLEHFEEKRRGPSSEEGKTFPRKEKEEKSLEREGWREREVEEKKRWGGRGWGPVVQVGESRLDRFQISREKTVMKGIRGNRRTLGKECAEEL